MLRALYGIESQRQLGPLSYMQTSGVSHLITFEIAAAAAAAAIVMQMTLKAASPPPPQQPLRLPPAPPTATVVPAQVVLRHVLQMRLLLGWVQARGGWDVHGALTRLCLLSQQLVQVRR